MKKLIIILISVVLMGCGVLSTGPLYDEDTCSGSYYQSDVNGDSAWWTFEDGEVFGAIKIKIKNDTGYLPVNHVRGTYKISDGCVFSWLIYNRCTFNYTIDSNNVYQWNGDPTDYNKPEGTATFGEFLIKHWDTDSILMEPELGTYGPVFEAERWNGLSLLDPNHQAY